jgi:predicted DNA-binding protein
MAAKKLPKKAPKQEAVRVDSTQITYLKYIAELTGVPAAAIVREAIQDHLDMSYSHYVSDIEEKRGLPASTCGDDATAKEQNEAFEQMLENLRDIKEAKAVREHLMAKAAKA